MQTLGLSESSTRTESRFKSLFWPSIESGADVDYLAVQGFWVCTVVGALSLVLLVLAGHPVTGIWVLVLFHFGGVGVREHNPFAAAAVLIYFAIDTWISGVGVVRIIVNALLLSNLRATWIASGWKADSEQAALPPRLGDTFSDKFADKWPAWIWPKVKWAYYVYAFGFLVLVVSGLVIAFIRRASA